MEPEGKKSAPVSVNKQLTETSFPVWFSLQEKYNIHHYKYLLKMNFSSEF
jgi:hypothetical protein